MERTITSETADLIFKAFIFQSVSALVNLGASDALIADMSETINKNAAENFNTFLEAEGITGIVEEVFIEGEE